MSTHEADLAMHMWRMGMATQKKLAGELMVEISKHTEFSAVQMREFAQQWVNEADEELARLLEQCEDEMS